MCAFIFVMVDVKKLVDLEEVKVMDPISFFKFGREMTSSTTAFKNYIVENSFPITISEDEWLNWNRKLKLLKEEEKEKLKMVTK